MFIFMLFFTAHTHSNTLAVALQLILMSIKNPILIPLIYEISVMQCVATLTHSLTHIYVKRLQLLKNIYNLITVMAMMMMIMIYILK